MINIDDLETLPNEEWKEHKIGIAVSNIGRIFIPKNRANKEHYTYGATNGRGYKIIQWKGRNYLVHRLVAESFITNSNNYLEVDHINRNKEDNRIENLRWASRSMQNINRVVPKNDAKSKQVMQIDISTNEVIRIWESTAECGRNGFNFSAVSACCLGKRNTHKGFKWKYVA